MDLEFTDELRDFQREVREFIEARLPRDIREKVQALPDPREGRLPPLAGHPRRAGLARLHVAGGARRDRLVAGAALHLRGGVGPRQRAADHPVRPKMVGPVIYTFGSEAQKAAYLPPIARNETWWCQGYSEPDAGSDLASLRTRAVRDGDHYVVNGTKTWTTAAHWADMMFCLVRTDTEVKAQEGISFVLIDMRGPGVEVAAHRHHGRRPGDQHRVPHRREGAGGAPHRRGEQGLDVCEVPARARTLRHRAPLGLQGPPVLAEGHRAPAPGGRRGCSPTTRSSCAPSRRPRSS